MEPLRQYLQAMGIPAEHPLIEAWMPYFEAQHLARGEPWQVEGRRCQHLAFLQKGMLSHYHYADGKERTRWVSMAPSFVTSLGSFIHQTPCLENIKALVPCALYRCGRSEFYVLKAQYPLLQQLWTDHLEMEVAGYEHRVSQLITTQAEQRYRNFIRQYPAYLERLPQKYLADMLGIELRHLSRIRKKLAKGDL